MSFSLFDILIIIGLSQGVLTSFLLLRNKQKELSKTLLGWVVLAFCLVNCKVLLHSTGLWDVPLWRYFPVGMELFIPGLIYLYILSLIEEDFTFQSHHVWHLMPGVLYALYDTAVYIAVVGEPSMQAKHLISNSLYFNVSNQIQDYLIAVLSVIYIAVGVARIRTFLSWLKQFKNYRQLPIYRWLRNIMLWSGFLVVVLVVNQMLSTLSIAMQEPSYRWQVFNVMVAFVTYYIGFMGYKNHGLKIHQEKRKLTSKANKLGHERTDDVEQLLRSKLEQENVFLDSELTLKKLASDMQTTAEKLSFVINQKMNTTFRDLLNQYRVNYAKTQFLQTANEQRSILDIAMQSGFNSQASFYRAFKKCEGVTPKSYIATLESDDKTSNQ